LRTACAPGWRQRFEGEVPFVIYSGYHPDSVDKHEFRDVPWIEKPCTITEITTALTAMTRLSLPQGALGPASASARKSRPNAP